MFLYFGHFLPVFINIQWIERGESLFIKHCSACHVNGNNRIIPEKNLKKETLEFFGMNNQTSLIYQITNGKNGMPAFGGRLKKMEIEEISSYLLK
jgi:cytochrome c6